jgi:ketosteroid isomerase-like protein
MTRSRVRLSLALAFAVAHGSAWADTPPAPAAAPPPVPAAAFGDAATVAAVRAAETAFAKSMADRDFAAFSAAVADDAVFVNGNRPQRGKAAILAAWEGFFSGPVPFSWRPETVVVLDNGQLAQTKGPVFDPAGNTIAEFRSTWRRDADGSWKIVFDDGAAHCGVPASAAQ